MKFLSWVVGLRRSDPAVAGTEATPSPAVSQSLSGDGDKTRALYQSGIEALERADFATAARVFNEILGTRHDDAEAHNYLGLVHLRQHRLEDAADCFVMAIHFRPEFAEAHYHLARTAQLRGAHRDAITHLDRALALRQDYAGAHNALGESWLGLGDIERAVYHFERAIAIQPDYAYAHSNLGYVLLQELGDVERGIAHVEIALRIAPNDPDVRCNYTMVLLHQGRCEEAIAICDQLLTASPDLHEARINRALAALKLGDFARAWPDYEARKLGRSNYIARNFPFAEWRGEPLAGKSVLAYAEQGIGDEIMFASCLPDLIARAGRCGIECTPRLQALFARSFPQATVYGGIQTERNPAWLQQLGRVDYQVAVGSLPGHFRRQLTDFPAHRGYLHADAVQVARWRAQLEELGAGLKIGISWRGGLVSTRRALRSIPLNEWLPVLRTSGCRFISLQYDDCSQEIGALAEKHGIAIQHWPSAFINFDATAALVSALDLVISVQTAVVHLSGALGGPAWVLVPAVAEWRYLDRGSTIPWYPSLQLFRQTRRGDWSDVIEAVRTRLQSRVTTSA